MANGYTIEDSPKSQYTIVDAPVDASQPTDFEKIRATDTRPALERMASGAWSGLKALNPFQGALSKPDAFQLMTAGLGPIPGIVRSGRSGYEKARGEGQGVIPSIASGVGSAVGLDAPGIAQRAQRGDVAGVIGEGIPAIAGIIIGGELADRVPSTAETKNWAAEKLRYPATARQAQFGRPGSIRPILPSALQRWTIPDWLIPQGEFGTETHPGPFSEIPMRMPRVGAVAPEEGFKPFQPSKGVARSMGKPSTNLGEEGTIPRIGENKARVPFYRQQELEAERQRTAIPDVNVIPEPRQAFPGEKEGTMFSVPREDLLNLGKQGKLGAGKTLQQLGKKVIYVPTGAER